MFTRMLNTTESEQQLSKIPIIEQKALFAALPRGVLARLPQAVLRGRRGAREGRDGAEGRQPRRLRRVPQGEHLFQAEISPYRLVQPCFRSSSTRAGRS